MRRTLLLSTAAGLVTGTLLAALPYLENDRCEILPDPRSEGVIAHDALHLWPLGTSCDYALSTGDRTIVHGASIPAGIAFVLLASLVFAAALLRPSPASRGAAVAAVLLALLGFLATWVELLPAGMFVLVFGLPIAYAAHRLFRASSRLESAVTAVFLPLVAFVLWAVPDFAELGAMGIVTGLAGGALAGDMATRLTPPRYRATPVPAA
jgi:hypothetical protein